VVQPHQQFQQPHQQFQQPQYQQSHQPPSMQQQGPQQAHHEAALDHFTALANLTSMGFDRASAERALKTSNGDVNAAVDLLTHG
jgi:NACalpha-BTF3-like transcription factor